MKSAKIGEFFLFKDPESVKLTIGKVTNIKDQVAFFDAYVPPENLPSM